ncbi:microneme protein MIC10 [Besnoitia besnoiti]|uniref:Microneme protein MIC10 n=1 Tax=Besnoitia besnoiti TaxID=94643 RepID=A0A2A9MNA7_BESBE|nr:microneme protein MIC10 [Besnoitia besnoiti]PFH38001.1 microneme protein MIC10 [Besnoitia besnoiti]
MAQMSTRKSASLRQIFGGGLLLVGAAGLLVALSASNPVTAAKVRAAESLAAEIHELGDMNDYNQEAEYRIRRAELDAQTPEEIEAAKQKYRENQAKQEQEDADMKRIKDAVVAEMNETVERAGLRGRAEREDHRSDDQQRGFDERQKEIKDMEPSKMAKLMDKRIADLEDIRKTKQNQQALMQELKDKLAKRKKAM